MNHIHLCTVRNKILQFIRVQETPVKMSLTWTSGNSRGTVAYSGMPTIISSNGSHSFHELTGLTDFFSPPVALLEPVVHMDRTVFRDKIRAPAEGICACCEYRTSDELSNYSIDSKCVKNIGVIKTSSFLRQCIKHWLKRNNKVSQISSRLVSIRFERLHQFLIIYSSFREKFIPARCRLTEPSESTPISSRTR